MYHVAAFKAFAVLSVLRGAVQATLKWTLVIILTVLENAWWLVFVMLAHAPAPSSIRKIRLAVQHSDPFYFLKQDTGVVGIVARFFL